MEARKKKKKILISMLTIILSLLILVIITLLSFNNFFNKNNIMVNEKNIMVNLVNQSLSLANVLKAEYDLTLNIKYEYNDEVDIDNIISQSIEVGNKINKGDVLDIVVSKGKLDLEKIKNDKIDELGKVPIMMYHGIIDTSETSYIGGNVDKDGYNRTAEAFRKDLEFYYENGYRMIRLTDYINGNIATEYGKSPIVLTFDDGNSNNIKVTGLDVNGNIIIDKNSAVGILEEFKKTYPDYNITATFFLNGGLFGQPEYNEKILKWLVENGYDIGNHTKGHINIETSTSDIVQENISYVYQLFDEIIPNQYVHIISLPFGRPSSTNNLNFKYIFNGSYNGYTYETEAALRVGWEPEESPYNVNFNKTYIKRCRAYDNNGSDFDIEMVFNLLQNNRYISDGDADTIITSSTNKNLVIDTKKNVIYY